MPVQMGPTRPGAPISAAEVAACSEQIHREIWCQRPRSSSSSAACGVGGAPVRRCGRRASDVTSPGVLPLLHPRGTTSSGYGWAAVAAATRTEAAAPLGDARPQSASSSSSAFSSPPSSSSVSCSEPSAVSCRRDAAALVDERLGVLEARIAAERKGRAVIEAQLAAVEAALLRIGRKK